MLTSRFKHCALSRVAYAASGMASRRGREQGIGGRIRRGTLSLCVKNGFALRSPALYPAHTPDSYQLAV